MCAGLKGATGRLSVFGHFVGRVEVLGIEPRAFAMSYFPTPLFFFFLKPRSHYVVQAVLEVTMWLRLASKHSSSLRLPYAGVIGVHLHAWLLLFDMRFQVAELPTLYLDF